MFAEMTEEETFKRRESLKKSPPGRMRSFSAPGEESPAGVEDTVIIEDSPKAIENSRKRVKGQREEGTKRRSRPETTDGEMEKMGRTLEKMKAKALKGTLSRKTTILREGLKNWRELYNRSSGNSRMLTGRDCWIVRKTK